MALGQLSLVFLWKNILYLRYKWLSLALIFLACYGTLLAFLKTTYKLEWNPSEVYESKTFGVLKVEYFPANDYDLIYYAPNTDKVNDLMENVRIDLEIPGERYTALDSVSEMRLLMEQSCRGNCFAVEFQHIPSGPDDGNIRYSISSNYMRISPKKRFVNDEEVNGIKEADEYIRTGFLTLQHVIDRQYIKSLGGTLNDNGIEIAAMPSIAVEHMGSQRLIYFGMLFSVLFSVLLLSTFLVPLVEEKQDGLKEFLIIATPKNFLNGATFFLVRLILYLLFLGAAFVVAVIYAALGLAPLFYMSVLFVLYVVSVTSYTYLISVCFNSVFYTKVGGFLLLIIPYIFYLIKDGISTGASYIFSTKTFLEGLDVFQTFTNKHHIFTTGDLFVEVKDGAFEIFSIYIILILQTLFYALLYNYLSYVFPGPGGLKQPYLFFLNPAFYKKRQRNEYTTAERGTDAIIIQELNKKFKTPTREICISDRLNMEIKNKQITVLLGHNGAGKTTTLNMIMGSVPKDSGKIIVCSERDVSSYRHLIGFCPQHSVFMHYMTCRQHLQFFAQLRGINKREALTLADSLLTQLKLTDKANEYGAKLSGGMKRRLSLGIALAGDTKVIVLDEPSSGLDIESRRKLWDILLELRKTKAVLVTTHYMEEAEVLGDTICILSGGRLKCKGSPLELKRKLGCGYILKLGAADQVYNEHDTMKLIQHFIPSAKVLNVVPPTVLISLPYAYRTEYDKTLRSLENAKESLGITTISITDTSLEDVFLNSAKDVDQVDAIDVNRSDTIHTPYERLREGPIVTSACLQFRAIAYKKLTFLRNEWIYALGMLLVPFLTILLAVCLVHSMSVVTNEHELAINLRHIRKGIVYLHNPTLQHARIEQILKELITSNGIEARKLEMHGHNSLIDELRVLQEKDLSLFLQQVIGVIDITTADDGSAKLGIYYSGNIYHSSVIMYNLVDTALVKLHQPKAGIDATYVPIRKFITDVSPSRLEIYAVIVSIGIFLSMFFYVRLPFRESITGFKDLQAMPGHIFWLATYTCDVLLHLLVCSLLFVIQLTIMPRELYTVPEQILIIAMIFFYGCSYLPILYTFANRFNSISTIATYLLFMLIISTIVPYITSGSLQAMKTHESKIMFLSLLPDFNLNHQLRVLNENFIIVRRSTVSVVSNGSRPAMVAAAQNQLSNADFFFYAILVGLLTMLLFVKVLEDKYKIQAIHNIFTCYTCRRVMPKELSDSTEEEELKVAEEKTLVADIIKEHKEEDYPLLAQNLHKAYNRKLAVRGISFEVRKGECFGVLGVNGAGKTSMFQMVATNSSITDGSIKIDGYDVRANEVQYRYRFGYCPQHDALSEFMTAYQALKYMALVRGIQGATLHVEVVYWLEKLDLLMYRDVQIRHYSGGTKRKLNAAMAMICSPSLVLLDEPTTGVDPVSRRFLWKCIQDFQKRDKTLVLTSHSMDECEQLCNRLAIMADGKFKCLDGICALKKRYGCGFTISAKMSTTDSRENVDYITNQLLSQFPESALRENHAGMLTYFVQNHVNIAWSNVFKRMEQFLQDCADLVADYSVNESTLEDIFLKFDTAKTAQCTEVAMPLLNIEEA